MPEITYSPEVRCEISSGLREGDVTAAVSDVHGRVQYIHVTPGLINHDGESSYIPIGFVEIDRRGRRVLIELPAEADSGANRLWVGFDDLKHEAGAPA